MHLFPARSWEALRRHAEEYLGTSMPDGMLTVDAAATKAGYSRGALMNILRRQGKSISQRAGRKINVSRPHMVVAWLDVLEAIRLDTAHDPVVVVIQCVKSTTLLSANAAAERAQMSASALLSMMERHQKSVTTKEYGNKTCSYVLWDDVVDAMKLDEEYLPLGKAAKLLRVDYNWLKRVLIEKNIITCDGIHGKAILVHKKQLENVDVKSFKPKRKCIDICT